MLSSIRKLGKSYETDLTKPNIEGKQICKKNIYSLQLAELVYFAL